jgi:hypothetical protein
MGREDVVDREAIRDDGAGVAVQPAALIGRFAGQNPIEGHRR